MVSCESYYLRVQNYIIRVIVQWEMFKCWLGLGVARLMIDYWVGQRPAGSWWSIASEDQRAPQLDIYYCVIGKALVCFVGDIVIALSVVTIWLWGVTGYFVDSRSPEEWPLATGMDRQTDGQTECAVCLVDGLQLGGFLSKQRVSSVVNRRST